MTKDVFASMVLGGTLAELQRLEQRLQNRRDADSLAETAVASVQAAQAAESRQVRRARERLERKRDKK